MRVRRRSPSRPYRCCQPARLLVVAGRRQQRQAGGGYQRPGCVDGIAARGRAGIGQHDRQPAPRPGPGELRGCRPQRSREVGGPLAPQREQVRHHVLDGPGTALALQQQGSIREGDHAVIDRRPPSHAGCSDSSSGETPATHRTGAVDHQAQGERWHGPQAAQQLVAAGRPAAGSGFDQPAEARVEVEIATGLRQPCRTHPPEPAGAHLPRRGRHVDHDPACEAASQRTQTLVGGPGEVGEQRQGLVGVFCRQLAERRLVQAARPRRDLREPVMAAGQVPPRLGASRGAIDLVACGLDLAFARAQPRTGARGFP